MGGWRLLTPDERRDIRQRDTIKMMAALLIVMLLVIGWQAWNRHKDAKVMMGMDALNKSDELWITNLVDRVDGLEVKLNQVEIDAKKPVSRGAQMQRLRVDELRELAGTVHAEARGEGPLGKMLVAKVAINRYRWNPGMTMHDVLHRPDQFATGTVYTDADMDAVYSALRDSDYNHLAGFHNPDTATDPEAKEKQILIKVGRHEFW